MNKLISSMKKCLAVIFALQLTVLHAESFTILGQSININLPAGFCILGNSSLERETLSVQRHNTALGGDLIQFGVPCTELNDFRSGRIDGFSRWVQVLVLKSKGQLKLVSNSRQDFLKGISRSANSPLDMASLEERMNKHLAKTDTVISEPKIIPLGVTPDAFFIEMQMNSGKKFSPVAGVGLITLVNKLPIGVYVYVTPNYSGNAAINTLNTYLNQIISIN